MLFKGTATRSAEDIAQAIDSIGGQLDAFTAKEYASYYIKVLDEHLPLAVDLLSDIVLRPAFAADEIEREKKVDPRRDQDGRGHAGRPRPRAVHAALLGRAPARPADPRVARKRWSRSRPDSLRDYFSGAYVAPNVVDLGGRQHRARGRSATWSRGAFDDAAASRRAAVETPRRAWSRRSSRGRRSSNRATSASARRAIRRATTTATSSYILNTVLGGSMSSRLFQNVREKRGLAYAVFSGLSAYRDAGQHHDLRRLRERSGRAR